MLLFFFFQAEDGIRDGRVTGVQTCALPIYPARADQRGERAGRPLILATTAPQLCTHCDRQNRQYAVTKTRAPRSTVELSPEAAGVKVLLVDDDYAILDGVSDFLECEGYGVVSASNGIDALNQLRSGLRVDAIVLDVMMPVMDGWDFRAEQLADPSLRGIPVVVISASGFSRETLQRQLSACEVLPKPLDLDGFLRALNTVC